MAPRNLNQPLTEKFIKSLTLRQLKDVAWIYERPQQKECALQKALYTKDLIKFYNDEYLKDVKEWRFTSWAHMFILRARRNLPQEFIDEEYYNINADLVEHINGTGTEILWAHRHAGRPRGQEYPWNPWTDRAETLYPRAISTYTQEDINAMHALGRRAIAAQ